MSKNIKNGAVILVSGGMDSLVCAVLAIKNSSDVAFLHIDYNQRTEKKEAECFKHIVNHYKPALSKILDFSWLGQMGGSALTDQAIPVPEHSLHTTEMSDTYVPFRNSVLLSAAVAWAEVLGANNVFYGAVQHDSSGYPDCTIDFVSAFNALIKQGSALNTIRIAAPLITMRKKDIIRKGISLNVPFEYTWSCYQNSHEACGVCDSCLLRLQAFQEAGIKDPIPYTRRL